MGGNLVLGDGARERLLDAPAPKPIAESGKGAAYVHLATAAASGGLAQHIGDAGGKIARFG